ncbi:hypothetical protein HHK36_023587 [Tetracentron sinense]|uniref:Uncharacterized protein n=1 Tax=Tetracentron sinense TaxID=13715 RepID=A0A834YP08_TETSI|nr:hypothetical protein HHK36_023587 [Tetracentron sinense]
MAVFMEEDADRDEARDDSPLYSDAKHGFTMEPRVAAPPLGRGRGRPPRSAALQGIARDRVVIRRESARMGKIPESHKNLLDTPLLKGLSDHLSVFTRSNLRWAHEYLEICRPRIIEGDGFVFPISCRWRLPTRVPANELCEDGDYESWFSTISIGRIMDDYIYRTGALEIGGEVGHLYDLRGACIVELEAQIRGLEENRIVGMKARIQELEGEVASLRNQAFTSSDPTVDDVDIHVPVSSSAPLPTQRGGFSEVAYHFFRFGSLNTFPSATPKDNFVRRCIWFHDFKPVLNTPGWNHMILVGLHGSALYTPNRVVRQFGWTQDIPVVNEEVPDVVDFGPSSSTLIAQLAKAWKERQILNAYDDKSEEPSATKEYTLWVQQLVEEHEKKLWNASLLGENAFLKDRTGTSASLSCEDATSKAEIANLMEEKVSLRAKVAELQGSLVGYDISHLAWMDEALELRKQGSTLERINEHFRYVQAPVGSQLRQSSFL